MTRLAIVASRFNEHVTDRLLANCLAALDGKYAGPTPKVVRVPGAYELPWTVSELARSARWDAIIALGCIMRGQTPQNDHIARTVVDSLQRIAIERRTPVILGVITPNTEAQAVARTRGAFDRGREAAEAALAMLKVRGEVHRGA